MVANMPFRATRGRMREGRAQMRLATRARVKRVRLKRTATKAARRLQRRLTIRERARKVVQRARRRQLRRGVRSPRPKRQGFKCWHAWEYGRSRTPRSG